MKKKAYWKEVFRAITHEKKRFISILVITALGVIMLTGLRAACVDLRLSADSFFDQQNLYDIAIQSTLGLTDDDVEVLASLDGISAAEGGYSDTVYLTGDSHESVTIKTFIEGGMNQPYVIEGSLPEAADEIAVSENYITSSGKSIGDTVTIEELTDEDEEEAEEEEDDEDTDADDEDADSEDVDADEEEDTFDIDIDIDTSDLDDLEEEDTPVFANTTFTITAIVTDPADINNKDGSTSFRDTSTTDYTFFVVPEAVDTEVYTVVYLTITDAAALNCYSDAYEETVAEVIDVIEEQIKEQQEAARTEDVISEAQEKIDDAQDTMNEIFADADEQLADADEEILDSRQQLDDAWEELEENETLLTDAQKELDDAVQELTDTEADTWTQIEEAKTTLAEALEELEATLEELESQAAQAKEELGDAWPTEAFDALRSTAAAGEDTTAAAAALTQELQTTFSSTTELLETQIAYLESMLAAAGTDSSTTTDTDTASDTASDTSGTSTDSEASETSAESDSTDATTDTSSDSSADTDTSGTADSDADTDDDADEASSSDTGTDTDTEDTDANADTSTDSGTAESDTGTDTSDTAEESTSTDTSTDTSADTDTDSSSDTDAEDETSSETDTDTDTNDTDETSTDTDTSTDSDTSESDTGTDTSDTTEDGTSSDTTADTSEDSSSDSSADTTSDAAADTSTLSASGSGLDLAALAAAYGYSEEELAALMAAYGYSEEELAALMAAYTTGTSADSADAADTSSSDTADTGTSSSAAAGTDALAYAAAAGYTTEELEEQLALMQEQLESLNTLIENLPQLAIGLGQIDAGIVEIEEQSDLLEEQEEEAAQQFEEAWATIADSQQELDDGLAELEDGRSELEDAEAEYADGVEQLAEAKETYQEEKEKAEQELADAQAEVDDIEAAVWYVTDRSSLSGYGNIDSDSGAIEAIGTAFPVVFLAVAILISLTTITRMVEEERGLIGTYKALGFTDAETRRKYLIFSLSASLAGSIVGAFGGFIVLPKIVFIVFGVLYTLPSYSFSFDLVYGLLGPAIFLVGTGLATWFSCRSVLHQTPATLMRPKTPASGSVILLERISIVWRRLSFLNKVTARNLFRYKKRLLMTTIGILGCTSLLVCGFAIKDSVSELLPRQYDEVYKYDLLAVATDNEELLEYMDQADEVDTYLSIRVDSVTVEVDGSRETIQLYVIPDESVEIFTDYITLESTTGEACLPDSSGVLITRNAGTILGFTTGDTVTLQDLTLASAEVTVTALVQNYLGNNVYMTQSFYESIFGEYEANAVLANLSDSCSDPIAWADELAGQDGITSATATAQLKEEFSTAFTLINMVVYIIIFMAACLAFVVLFTLSMTNISERERELATIKVLGFFDREVHLYVNKETLILTCIGIIPGLIAGTWLGHAMTSVLNMPSLYFAVSIYPISYVYSAGLTILFALLVQQITNRTLNNIDPVEALKSVE